MKLILAIVQRDDAGKLVDQLVEKGYRATRIDTAGGFLKARNASILMGVDDEQVDEVLAIIYDNCKTRTKYVTPIAPLLDIAEASVAYPVEVQVGGATIFVLNVERFERG